MKKDDGSENTIYLVSCVGQKNAITMTARELYVSDWFRKARRYVESTECSWFILSAEYGLVSPEKMIAPYEKTLNGMPVAERRRWAQSVIEAIEPVLLQVDRVVFLAGVRYREVLSSYLRNRGIVVDVPMEGLRIGQQLQWLGKQCR